MNTLYRESPPIVCPGCMSWVRTRRLTNDPVRPAAAPKRKYIVPISLWLVESNHRVKEDMDRWLT